MNTDGNTHAINRHLAERGVYDEQQEQEAKLAEVEAELHMMKTAGVIEVAVRNPSVSEYMAHWEARAEAAEAMLLSAYRAGVEDAAQGLEPKNPIEDWTDFARQHHADAISIRALPTPTIEQLKEMLKENGDE